jgi:hypothetical protein
MIEGISNLARQSLPSCGSGRIGAMEETANPYESPIEAGQPVRVRWKRPTLIALLLLTPVIMLALHASVGMLPMLVVGIVLNICIRSLKRLEQTVKVFPFFVFAMLLTAAYIVLLLWSSR